MNITTEFSAALARAGARLRGVEHDAQNKYHGYKYTSSEAMVAAARDVLSAEGLAMVVTSWTLTVRALPDGGGVVRTMPDGGHQKMAGAAEVVGTMTALLFGHGGCIEIHREQPVIPEKGRPMDKAAAGADTQCLSYILRGALLIDRPDENDVEQRDDGGGLRPEPKPKHEPKREAKAPPKPEAPKSEGMRAEDVLAQLAAYAGCTTEDVYADLTRARVLIPEPGQPWDRDSWRVVDMGLTARAAGRPYDGWLAWAAAQMGRKAAEPSTQTKGESKSSAPRVPSRRVYETQAEQDTLAEDVPL